MEQHAYDTTFFAVDVKNKKVKGPQRRISYKLKEKIEPFALKDKIKTNLSVPGIQRCQENALCKSIVTSPLLICL